MGAKQGILFKTAASLETTGYTGTVVLDKTGTVTTGEPTVVEIVGTRKVPDKFLLSMAAGLESQSEHPLAKAILARAEADGIRLTPAKNIRALPRPGAGGAPLRARRWRAATPTLSRRSARYRPTCSRRARSCPPGA